MLAQRACLLTHEQVHAIHEASLTILEEVGLLMQNEAAREVFQCHGCHVDTQTKIVRLPQTVVEGWRQAFPNHFRFFGRDPQYDVTLPDDGPAISTCGSAPDVLDLETGERRRATSEDIARMAHLANELPGIDIFAIPTLADDAPDGMFSLTRFYAAVKNCQKPVRGGGLNPQEIEDIIRLGEIVAGGKEAYWERPFFHFACCAIISPLIMDRDQTALCMHCTQRGITATVTLFPSGGLTAPLTMAGRWS